MNDNVLWKITSLSALVILCLVIAWLVLWFVERALDSALVRQDRKLMLFAEDDTDEVYEDEHEDA